MNQIKKLIERFREYLNKIEKNKLSDYLIIVIIIGVIILIAGGSLFKNNKNDAGKNQTNEKVVIESSNLKTGSSEKDDTIKKIEAILSQIEGAGKVSVMITYVSGKEIVPASDIKRSENETQEKDSGGGTRSIKQSDYESKIITESGNKPIVIKEVEPVVKGVVVVADGAGDARVRENLSKAVQALLDVPIHKIQVFVRDK